MVSLKDFVKQEEITSKFHRCKLCQLPKELLNEVMEALNNKTVAKNTIIRWLSTHGYNIHKSTLEVHYEYIKQQSKDLSTDRSQRKTITKDN